MIFKTRLPNKFQCVKLILLNIEIIFGIQKY